MGNPMDEVAVLSDSVLRVGLQAPAADLADELVVVAAVLPRVRLGEGRHGLVELVEEYGYSWRVMADPEGNEFCLIYGMP